MTSDWYVLAVQPRKENYVKHQLRSSEYSVALPSYLKTIRHARRQTTKQAPLFPGYLFVKLGPGLQGWRQVNCVPGAIGFLKFGNTPSPLQQDFVCEFISELNAHGIVEFEQSFNRGDQVRALHGPFNGRTGEVISMSDSARVKVLMEALNRKVELTLDSKSVIAAA